MMSGEYLSHEGRQRREEILHAALAAARRRRSVRHARVAGLALVLLTAGAIVFGEFSIRKSATMEARLPQPIVPQGAKPLVVVEMIQTDPGIANRLSSGNSKAKWTAISDDELVQSLADAGHPSGLVEMNGRWMLLGR